MRPSLPIAGPGCHTHGQHRRRVPPSTERSSVLSRAGEAPKPLRDLRARAGARAGGAGQRGLHVLRGTLALGTPWPASRAPTETRPAPGAHHAHAEGGAPETHCRLRPWPAPSSVAAAPSQPGAPPLPSGSWVELAPGAAEPVLRGAPPSKARAPGLPCASAGLEGGRRKGAMVGLPRRARLGRGSVLQEPEQSGSAPSSSQPFAAGRFPSLSREWLWRREEELLHAGARFAPLRNAAEQLLKCPECRCAGKSRPDPTPARLRSGVEEATVAKAASCRKCTGWGEEKGRRARAKTKKGQVEDKGCRTRTRSAWLEKASRQ